MRGFKGVRLITGERVDVVLDGARVGSIRPGAGLGVDGLLDAEGMLLVPAYIDTHVHLDKALIRDELREHEGTLAAAIEAIHERKRRYTVDDVRTRARQVIESSVLHGTTRLRSHVDVDTIGGLTPLQGVLAAARDCSDIAEVRTIAFPQEGILRDPGAAGLMRAAMDAGCDVVGGMPHWETTESDQREHVRLCFELGERFDADLDMHVDETDDGSVRTLDMVADEALRRGWEGRVTAGHVCSLAAADDDYAARVIEKCARAGITVVTNPVTNLVVQGRGDRGLVRRGVTRIAELRAAGVNLCFGQDCVKDGFYPYGRGDMLEVALISAHVAHLATRDDLRFALDAVTENPARAWHLADYGVRAGARADLQLLDAPSWEEAIRLQKPPRVVVFGGREVVRSSLRQELTRGEGAVAASVRVDLPYVVTYDAAMAGQEENKAASRRLYEEVFGRGTYEVADQILAADMIGHGPGSPPLVGTEQIKRQAALLRGAFPDLTVTLEDQFAAGDRVCSRWSSTGTHTGDLAMPTGNLPATGNRVAFEEIRIDRYAGGRIVESWFIPDRLSLWRMLGLIPAPPV